MTPDNCVPLRDYFTALREADDRAIEWFREQTREHFESVNGLQQQLLERDRKHIEDMKQYLTMATYNAKHEGLENRLRVVERNIWLATGGLALLGFLSKFVHF